MKAIWVVFMLILGFLHIQIMTCLLWLQRVPRPDLFTIQVLLAVLSIICSDFLTFRIYRNQINLQKEHEVLTRHKTELMSLASRDSLTGLYNRRGILTLISDEELHLKQNKCLFSIMLVDIDHFKSINDCMGHGKGDWILIQIAEQMRASTRRHDQVARWGGDEFLVLLPETSVSEARTVAEHLLKCVESLSLDLAPGLLQPTLSIGVSDNKNGKGIDEMLALADRNLYQAKYDGGNRVGGDEAIHDLFMVTTALQDPKSPVDLFRQ